MLLKIFFQSIKKKKTKKKEEEIYVLFFRFDVKLNTCAVLHCSIDLSFLFFFFFFFSFTFLLQETTRQVLTPVRAIFRTSDPLSKNRGTT